MKHLLLTTIAAVLVVGCGESQSPEPPTAKAPAISIHHAAETGNIEAVKQHLAAGVDVNAKGWPGWKGWTPLHYAVNGGSKEIAELLLAKGADVNAKDDDGYTPLYYTRPHWEIANLLRDHGGKTGEELKAKEKWLV